MASRDKTSRASRVPAGRIERLARFGWLAGSVAAGAMAEGARRFVDGERPALGDFILTPATADKLVRHLSRMRGAAMKVGQLLSLEADITLPKEFGDILGRLQDSGETMPKAQLHRVLGREYGRGWQEKFREFDEEPFASASIGQVHRAVTLRGREVALKIQFPGVAKSIESDVDNLAALMKAVQLLPANLDLKPHITEVKRQLRRETDYEDEAKSMRRYRRLVKDDERFVVPKVHKDLSTKRILATDYVEARPLAELWEQDAPRKIRDAVGTATQDLVLRELFEFGFMQSDPNFANYLVTPDDGTLVLLDFGSMVDVSAEVASWYSRLLRTAVGRDKPGLVALAVELGWLDAEERSDRVDGFCELMFVCCEPLGRRGRYDYGETDLAERARDLGLDLAFRRGLIKPPPPEMLFINRKLGGTFLLSARLGARVASRTLIDPYLED